METVIDEINNELRNYNYENIDKFVDFLISLFLKKNFEKDKYSSSKYPTYISLEKDIVIRILESDLRDLMIKNKYDDVYYSYLLEDNDFKETAQANSFAKEYTFYRLSFCRKESIEHNLQ